MDDVTDGQRERVFATLKKALRSQGVTYRQLGQEMGLSESAIKKIFSNKDCSLGRLTQIAAVAGLPLARLFELSQELPFERVSLSHGQQTGLLRHPAAFALFWMLSVELLTVAQIKQRHGLDDKRCRRLLSLLDELGLIVLGVDDSVQVVHRGLVRWADEGPLLAHIHDHWPRRLLRDAQESPQGLHRLHELHLRPETAAELRQELAALLDDFLRRARYEQHTTNRPNLDVVRLVLGVAPGSFVPTIPDDD